MFWKSPSPSFFEDPISVVSKRSKLSIVVCYDISQKPTQCIGPKELSKFGWVLYSQLKAEIPVSESWSAAVPSALSWPVCARLPPWWLAFLTVPWYARKLWQQFWNKIMDALWVLTPQTLHPIYTGNIICTANYNVLVDCSHHMYHGKWHISAINQITHTHRHPYTYEQLT